MRCECGQVGLYLALYFLTLTVLHRYVDNDLRARSYPLACSNPNGSVHWSERFSLEQAWHIRNCHIIIRIIDRNGLVSDFGTADIDYARLIQQQTPGDCRIYITPLGSGEVLGDLRLELRYIELKIERKVEYDKVWKVKVGCFVWLTYGSRPLSHTSSRRRYRSLLGDPI